MLSAQIIYNSSQSNVEKNAGQPQVFAASDGILSLPCQGCAAGLHDLLRFKNTRGTDSFNAEALHFSLGYSTCIYPVDHLGDLHLLSLGFEGETLLQLLADLVLRTVIIQ